MTAPADRPPIAAEELKRRVVADWSARAASFDQGDSCVTRTEEITGAWREIFRETFGDAPKDVLDVGSGTGELALLFHSLGHRVRGIDLAPGMLATARAKIAARGADVRIDEGDAEAPPFPDASFDVVHARHVVQLLPDPERALAAWIRILRPGGLVFITATQEDGAPARTALARLQRPVGRAVLRTLHALGIDRRPVSPPRKGAGYDELLPMRRRLGAKDLEAFLVAGGLVDVHVRDLLALRLRGRDAMTWYRRWANPPKRAYHAAWGRKP